MQNYSQFASKYVSMHVAQNRVTYGPLNQGATRVDRGALCLCGLLRPAILSLSNCLWTCWNHRKLLGMDLLHSRLMRKNSPSNFQDNHDLNMDLNQQH